MRTHLKRFGVAVALFLAVGGAEKASAQFVAPTYNLNNQLPCRVRVFLEFSTCPSGGVYYSSITYIVPPLSSLTIPVNPGEDAWVVVTVPGATPNPLNPVVAAGHPCIGLPINTVGTNACGVAGATISVTSTPTDLFITP